MAKLALLLMIPGLCYRSAWFDTYGEAKAFIDAKCETADVAWVEATPIPGKPGLYGAPYRAQCEWE